MTRIGIVEVGEAPNGNIPLAWLTHTCKCLFASHVTNTRVLYTSHTISKKVLHGLQDLFEYSK